MQGSGLTGLTNDEVIQIVQEAATKFPEHQGLIAIKSSLSATPQGGLIGQPAPDFTLPDPNGNRFPSVHSKGNMCWLISGLAGAGPVVQKTPMW